MNKLTIIGNLTKAPELRTTQSGLSVCTFTVAVNRRRTQESQPEADFFRVTVWRQLGENCAKYLDKGRKVCVIGPVSISTYTGQDGKTRAQMEVTADDVEFLTPKNEQAADQKEAQYLKNERDGIKNDSVEKHGSPYVNATPLDLDDLPF